MSRDFKISLIITGIASLLFIPFIGKLYLFDWDEINFAESAREMLLTKDFMTVRIFFEPFWEKPPLFIWLQVLSMKIFGINEFAARFPNAIAGIITLNVLYFGGRKLLNEKFGIIWAVAYGVSILPFTYFKSGIIDPWFNLFIFLGVAFYIYAQKEPMSKPKFVNVVLSAAFLGLAVLTKGPVAILVFGLTVFILLIIERFKLYLNTGQVATFVSVVILVGGFWFILQILTGNWQTVVDFFVYQIRLFKEKDAGHGGFPLYHFFVLFIGVFPASVFAIYGHKKIQTYPDSIEYFRKVMLILFWVVLILFSIVKTKIVHYSSLCYFPISFLAAYVVYDLMDKKRRAPRWLTITLICQVLIIGLTIITFPVFDMIKNRLIETQKITHAFTIGNLQADPGYTGFEVLIGILLIIGFVIGVIWIKKDKIVPGFKMMAVTSAITIFMVIYFITPGIEMYTQNALIEFFESKKTEDAYFQTHHKSYTKYFYADLQEFDSDNPFIKALKKEEIKRNAKVDKNWYFTHWILTGDIDKDAYFVMRINKKEKMLSTYPALEVIQEKNGYVFCKRKAVQENETKDY